ncbi:MAG: SoxR reducing system RseC family protein [Sedimentisphaerales bacterium]
MDIYEQLGRTKGPSIVGKVLLAFVLPLLLFIGSLIVAEYLLSGLKAADAVKALLAFTAAVVATGIFVQIIRTCTKKPVNPEETVDRKS